VQVDSAVEKIVVGEKKQTKYSQKHFQCDSLTAKRIIRTKQTSVIEYSCANKFVPTVGRAVAGCRKTTQFTKSTFS
jgi:hypothetical protein